MTDKKTKGSRKAESKKAKTRDKAEATSVTTKIEANVEPKREAEVWRDGYPEKVGVYRCKVNGDVTTLMHKICVMNGKHRWMTVRGHDVVGTVKWTAGRLGPEDL